MSSALQFLVTMPVFGSTTVVACGTRATFESKRLSASDAGSWRRMLLCWRQWGRGHLRRLLSPRPGGSLLFGDRWLRCVSVGVGPFSFFGFSSGKFARCRFCGGNAPPVGNAAQNRGVIG
uniref:Secreted protein n=1 Tax=Ixodes ricinus TaxID=34613 RepID=A0A6B0UMK0_IXORI